MYTIKEIVLKNKHHKQKRKVIDFHDPEMAIVAEFLMSDASLLNFSILQQIESVLSGKQQTASVNGNRCAVHMTKHQTVIEDLMTDMFDGIQTYETYKIDTATLKELILMWRNELQK